jgi:hypothetical protein
MRVPKLGSFSFLTLALLATTAGASHVIERLPPPGALLGSSDEPWIVRGQTETRFAALDSAGSFGDLPCPNANISDECCDNGDCDSCGCDSCGYGNWWSNTSVLFAADGWRTRADDDYPGSWGFRTGFNTGLGWWDSPVRLQIGGSYAGYDLSGRDGDFGAGFVDDASVEQQMYFTGGVYRRSDVCAGERIAWGLVGDVLYDNRFGEEAEEILLTQFRAAIAYAWDECNEFGVWGASRGNWQRLFTESGDPFRVRGLAQLNAFWHRNWAFGGDTWIYVGGGEEPVEWVVGLTGQAPLSQSVALFGGLTWGIPSAPAGDQNNGQDQNYSEEYWNVSFGIVWYPGCKAANDTVSGHRGLPLLPVADNGSFLVKARPGNL